MNYEHQFSYVAVISTLKEVSVTFYRMRMYETHATEIVIKWSITTWRKTLLANSRLAPEAKEELENYIVGTFDMQFVSIHWEQNHLANIDSSF